MKQPLTVSAGAVLRAVATIAGCLLAAVVVANLVDLVRPQALLRGRDFTRVAGLGAALIAAAAFLRSRRQVNLAQVLVEGLVLQGVIAAAIWGFSGVVAVDRLFLDWWLAINLWVVLPWMAASAARAALPAR